MKCATEFRKKNNLEIADKYFNSGVMLFDVENLRHSDFNEKVAMYVKDNECSSDADQIILNSVLRGKVKYLSFIYNCRPGDFSNSNSDYLNKYAYIIHYNQKPWNDHGILCGEIWWKLAFNLDIKRALKIWFRKKL